MVRWNPWTSYRRLEGGENRENNDDAEFTNRKHGLPERGHPLGAAQQYIDETTQSLRTRVEPFSNPMGRWLCSWTSFMICVSAFSFLVLYAISITTLLASLPPKAPDDVLQYIDPLIGTGQGGHVFAGATLPFGMAKAVADVSGEAMGGFASDGAPIVAFSHTHDSGTGGSSSMGNFPIFIHNDCRTLESKVCDFQRWTRKVNYTLGSVVARPGYFALDLQTGIRAEMTTSEHAALYKFTFLRDDAADLNPIITLDGSDLMRSSGQRDLYLDNATARMTAEGSFPPSFGRGRYDAYVCVDFQGAQIRDAGGWNGTSVYPGIPSMSGTEYGGSRRGLFARFQDVYQNDTIKVRVGLSWLSRDRACENAEREIADWDFDRLRNSAEDAWRKKFEPIAITHTGVDSSYLRNFWGGVYRSFLSPQDYTGENQLWSSTEPYYDSWYCIWDTFRGVHPFLTLVDPISQSRMVRSLIDIYRHDGYLPDCRMSFCKGYTQGGSNADVVLVDAFIKKLPGVDWDAAYAALIKDAEEQPERWDVEGRGGLASWKSVGYIPYLDADAGGYRTRSISRTVEYAYNDFCIAEMANATGKQADYEKYVQRASNWKNVFKMDHESMGFTGFPQPRWVNGSWGFQNATLCSSLNNFGGCYLNPDGHETYEGSPWLYSFYVPGDVRGLIGLLGGRESFVRRLDKLHDSGVLYIGDEQAFLTTFLYHYVGRPGLSAQRTHSYIPRLFNDTRAGIPGNDDSGAMGTFVFFNMLGIFPNAGQSVYMIIPPFFPSVSITNPLSNRTATIRNVNFDPTYKRMFIQSATLDGKPYTKNWVDHGFFTDGGILELTLGSTESNWGTNPEDAPPSLSTGLYLP